MTPCEKISKDMGALFSCSEVNGYVRVRTPFLYPDGDVIDLFVSEHGGNFLITDLGETMRWLSMQSLSSKRSKNQLKHVEDIRLTHGLEFIRGMLQTRVGPDENFAAAMARVAQGALRVADIWFTMRTRSFESTTDEVELFLIERGVFFERSQAIPGRSGTIWRPDFHTSTEKQSSFVFVLSTGSKSAAHGVRDHVLAAWYDLSNLTIGPQVSKFVSLFDDTMDVWSDQDFNLLRDLSEIALWSNPHEFAEIIAA